MLLPKVNICRLPLLTACVLATVGSFAEIRYEVHRGPIDEKYLPQLRVYDTELFCEYPYLFIATPEHEAWYWKALSTPSTVLILAFDGEAIVGAMVGISTEEDLGHGRTLSKHEQYGKGKSFYIPWVAVATAYQKRGIGRSLMHQCESAVREDGYKNIYLATVMRAKRHPFQPVQAFDPDKIWRQLEFEAIGMYELWLWPTRVGVPGNESVATVDNMVQFWHKKITQ